MSEYSALRIEKMPHGGFVVTDGRGDAGFITAALFAATSIGEALDFIEGRLLKDCRGCHGGTSKCDTMGGGLKC